MLGIDKLVKKALSNRSEVVIDAPVDMVFKELASLGFLGDSVEKTSKGPMAVGTTFLVTGQTGQGGTVKVEQQVTDFVPNRRLVYQGKVLGTATRFIFEVEQVDGGTRTVYKDERLKLGFVIVFFLLPFIGWLFLPLLWAARQWDHRTVLRRIKKRVESGVYVPFDERIAAAYGSVEAEAATWEAQKFIMGRLREGVNEQSIVKELMQQGWHERKAKQLVDEVAAALEKR